MTGLEALQALRNGNAKHIRRTVWNADMYISYEFRLDPFRLSQGYDYFIEAECQDYLEMNEYGYIIERCLKDLFEDDWEIME